MKKNHKKYMTVQHKVVEEKKISNNFFFMPVVSNVSKIKLYCTGK